MKNNIMTVIVFDGVVKVCISRVVFVARKSRASHHRSHRDSNGPGRTVAGHLSTLSSSPAPLSKPAPRALARFTTSVGSGAITIGSLAI